MAAVRDMRHCRLECAASCARVDNKSKAELEVEAAEAAINKKADDAKRKEEATVSDPFQACPHPLEYCCRAGRSRGQVWFGTRECPGVVYPHVWRV